MSYIKQMLTTGVKVATGQIVSQPCVISTFQLLGGSDAATAKFYDGNDTTGALRAVLGAAANTSNSFTPDCPIRFKLGCYVVLTGTAPTAIVGIPQPANKN